MNPLLMLLSGEVERIIPALLDDPRVKEAIEEIIRKIAQEITAEIIEHLKGGTET